MTDQTRFQQTIADFDAINAKDPNKLIINDVSTPKSLIYAERLSEMLNRYTPNVSEVLKLAARAQHIQRWSIPRSDYPMTKPGYMQWRNKLKTMHADIAAIVMQDNGYDEASIQQVSSLLKKENLRSNQEMQTLEDVIVLAFLEHDLDDFAQQHADYTEEKMISIVRKSYFKMTEKGQTAALTLINIPDHLLSLVKKAIV